MSVGMTANVVDYTILNILSFALGWPIWAANTVSATLSSVVSYRLNKRIVFHDRMHGRVRTLVVYALIIAFGVVVIQAIFIHIFYDLLSGWLHAVIALNIAKAGASFLAFLWNYTMMRRFVFVTKSEANHGADTSG